MTKINDMTEMTEMSDMAEATANTLTNSEKLSLNKGFYKTLNHRYLEGLNDRKDIQNYDDIWRKGLPSSFEDLKNLNADNYNLTDITSAIYNSDYADIKSFRAIVFTKTDITLYMPQCGCWVEQKATEEIRHIVERFMNIVKKLVIDRIDLLNERMKKAMKLKEDADIELTEKERKQFKLLTEKSKFYVKLYNFIGGNQQESIIKRLIHKIVMETKMDETFKLENFNRATGYIAFNDGVYSFEKGDLIGDTEAYKLLLTKTTGYDYDKVLNVSDKTYEECKMFIHQIIPNEGILNWLLRRYNKSFQSFIEKLILVYHGERGNNGKTKLLELINKALGEELYVKCSKKLLNAESINNAGSANEELMSINGAVFVAFSEPNSKKAFDMSILKELSGADDITGRRLFKGKEKFKAKALLNIACNEIPSLDDADEASFNRLRCIPFNSFFTTDPNKVNEEENVYMADINISNYFDEWKYAFMKIVLESKEDVEEPIEVKDHTQKYREQEDVVRQFVNAKVQVVKNQDGSINKKRFIQRDDLWDEFKDWLKKENDDKKMKKKDFVKSVMTILDNFKADTVVYTTRVYNVFLGYKVLNEYSNYVANADNDDYDN